MGSHSSKPCNKVLEIGGNCDPRSPNPEITRTPLQNKNGAKHNITKNVDLRKTFEGTVGEEKLIHNNPILSAVIKSHLQSYDPRSPTQDFERTPIVITSNKNDLNEEKQLIRELSDNDFGSPSLANDDENKQSIIDDVISEPMVPRNLCDGFFDLTLDDSFKHSELPLGSSTASTDSIEKEILNDGIFKPTTLLETNFDYIEAANDAGNDLEQNRKSEEILDDNILKTDFKILDNDPRSPSIGIERTPIVVSKMDESNVNNVEEMSDDTLIKVLQSTNIELRQTCVDKNPEGMLIYEDESINEINDTPKKTSESSARTKSACNSGSRTPLSCMKNKADMAHYRSKSANLFEQKSHNGAKNIKRISHIPRLKSLSKPALILRDNNSLKSTVSGDCENTPPHSHRDRWDKDNSIVL